MSAIFIHGLGAVSPAGWGVAALRETMAIHQPLPVQFINRPGWDTQLAIRAVPPPLPRPPFLGHPRLRRAATISQHAIAAALEAVGSDAALVQSGALRLGVIATTMAGSVTYSRRFYEEVLLNPAIASPLLFPETVFNAPASHLAAYLNSPGINYTLVGDDGTFLQGLALAAEWLAEDRVDACVVLGMEELDWIVGDAGRIFQRTSIHAGGAGALYLKKQSSARTVLAAITDTFPFTKLQSRAEATRRMRGQLGPGTPTELLCDSANKTTWPDWPGQRLSPKGILGEAFNASAAWQCVLACDQIVTGQVPAATVSIVGANQQAIGARFTQTTISPI